MSAERSKGLLSLGLSFVLALGAVGTAVSAAFLDAEAVLGVLAIAACLAFAALIFGFVSLRGPRTMGSALAIVGGLLVLGGVGIGFGAAGFSQLMDLAEAPLPAEGHAEAVVDEMFRFRLAPPTPDARMYNAVSARTVNARARAGFWSESHSVTGLVFVEPLYGRTLPSGIEQELAATFATPPDWQSDAVPVTYLGHEAFRVRRRWVTEGSTFHSESTFFTRGDWLFHLYGVQEDFHGELLDVWFSPVVDNFIELDGEIEYTDVPRRALVDEGRGWRVQEDAYEDGLWGLRVETGPDFELSWWHRSTDLENRAVATLVQRRPDLSISISPYALGGRDPEVVVAGLRAAFHGISEAVDLPPIETEVDGRPVTWEARAWVTGYRQEARAAWWYDETRVVELVAWSPERAVTDSVLAQIDSHIALDTPRRALPSERRNVTEHAWISGGVIHFEDYEVSWRCPSDLWRVLDHKGEEQEGLWRLARIEAPTLGVSGRLVAEHLGNEREIEHRHDGWVEWLVAEATGSPAEGSERRVPFSAGGLVGLRSDGLPRGETVVAVSTIDAGGAWSYTLELTASAEDARTHGAAIRAALEGLAHADLEPRGHSERAYVDPRLGYEVAGFAADEVDTEWTELDGEVGSLVHFMRLDGDAFAVMSGPLSPYETPEDQAERLIGRFYAWVDDTPGTWTPRTATLAGYQAHVRELREPFDVSHSAVYRLVHEGILYVIIAYSVGSDLTVDDLAARFSLR